MTDDYSARQKTAHGQRVERARQIWLNSEVNLKSYHLRARASKLAQFKTVDGFAKTSEHVIRGVYSRLLSPGDTVIDVGVHYGIHSIPMAHLVGSTGTVLAIEASEQLFAHTGALFAEQGLTNIRYEHVAATDHDGDVEFHINIDATGHSGLMKRKESESDRFRDLVVPGRKIDTLLSEHHGVRFIKIDVEGGEALVIKGAQGVIAASQPVIIFEGRLTDSVRDCGLKLEDLREVLAGYSFCDLFGAPVSWEQWGGEGWNFVAYPKHMDVLSVAHILSEAWNDVIASS